MSKPRLSIVSSSTTPHRPVWIPRNKAASIVDEIGDVWDIVERSKAPRPFVDELRVQQLATLRTELDRQFNDPYIERAVPVIYQKWRHLGRYVLTGGIEQKPLDLTLPVGLKGAIGAASLVALSANIELEFAFEGHNATAAPDIPPSELFDNITWDQRS